MYIMLGDVPGGRFQPDSPAPKLVSRGTLMIASTRAMMPDLLTVRDVARRLSISERTVWRWTALGILPAPVHLHARSTRWRAADLERYLEGLVVNSGPGDRHGETLSRGTAAGGHPSS
jgi:predicted DNA-binding transcriptional regulator AlpA